MCNEAKTQANARGVEAAALELPVASCTQIHRARTASNQRAHSPKKKERFLNRRKEANIRYILGKTTLLYLGQFSGVPSVVR
jgi:hypothetical protein